MTDWVRSFPEAEEARSKAADLAARKRKWVTGGEHTAEELLAMERARRAAFYERNPDLAA